VKLLAGSEFFRFGKGGVAWIVSQSVQELSVWKIAGGGRRMPSLPRAETSDCNKEDLESLDYPSGGKSSDEHISKLFQFLVVS
jgi:hypothetical protein